MSILVYGQQQERSRILELIQDHFSHCISSSGFIHSDSYDHYLMQLRQQTFRAVFVSEDGAAGIESVRAARMLCTDTPVVWFSDDYRFAPHSRRLNAAYFAVKPIEHHHIAAALECCTA